MSTPTDTAKLADEIEALVKKATPGPWGLRVGGNYADDVWVASDAERPWESHMALKLWSRTMGRGDYEIGSPEHKSAIANADLLVSLVNSAPTIIAALRELDALKAENAKLREALEPFAAEAATYDCDDDDEDSVLIPDKRTLMIEEGSGALTESIITVGDFRRARAALGGAG